jgi:3-deoxy-D-manno-octulosonic-acid transferase
MRFLYNIFVYLYKLGVRLAAFFGNKKARKWLKGRNHIFKDLKAAMHEEDKIIWFHCASLGEFEQGRPLIETMKKSYPGYKILLTFFSPSGYEVRKDYPLADYVFYLPSDTRRNARKFVQIVRPRLVFFIKYEFWFNYMNELYNQKVPYFMVSVIFRPSQHFFRFWGTWFRRQLRKITYLFVQDERSLELLDRYKLYHADMIGDTRFDRVAELAEAEKDFPVVREFVEDTPVMIAGSTWPADEEKLTGLMQQIENIKLVIAPHQVGEEHIDQLKKRFEKFGVLVYSEAGQNKTGDARVLVIDGIGFLSYLYRYATIVYIGGGFGVGIHNLLEAATYGKPVIFGPNHEKFREAGELIANGGGFAIRNTEELIEVSRDLLTDKKHLDKSSAMAKNYVKDHTGATKKVLEKAKEYLIV